MTDSRGSRRRRIQVQEPGDAERRPLLDRAGHGTPMDGETFFSCNQNVHAHLPVYTNIHRIRRDVIAIVEDYLTFEQLRDLRLNISVVRPLVDKLYELDDISIAGFEPFQNAPEEVRREASLSSTWNYHNTLPALEVAILSESKHFLSSTHCQKVIEAIYIGQVVYTPSSFVDMIPDRYKQKPIALYEPRTAPLVYEICFSIYGFGWVLDQFATILAHGWIHGWVTDDVVPGQQAVDVLAMGAPVLIPRLAFNLLSDNLVFLSLRSMMADFTALTALSACGVQNSTDFHWLLGPILMVTFAFLGNTLFLTILVSMLSNTFSTIVANATAEIAFRRAVLTLEGVKGDAIFAYQPPFNIIALFILVPMRFFVNARWFHKIHVATVRAINTPILLIIALLERRLLWPNSDYGQDPIEQLPKKSRSKGWFWEKWKITTHSDIQTVFEIAPPTSVVEDIAVDDELTHHMIRRQFGRQQSSTVISTNRKRDSDEEGSNKNFVPKAPSRRDSIAPWGDLSEQVRDIMNETVGVENLSNRIDNLEHSTARIERMLGKLCGDDVFAEEDDRSPLDEEGRAMDE
ncbi:hypothetical protein SLS62_009467 [Diatrype stigma]|uniref:Calcium channel YVC1-like C-terminal transmembrane domain-containing protein n=1 Tax=Diatrype stigma TaxID=117547 RepID=A0AAN9YKH6_9PEZI